MNKYKDGKGLQYKVLNIGKGYILANIKSWVSNTLRVSCPVILQERER